MIFMKNQKKITVKNADNKVIKIKTGFESKNLVHTPKLRTLLIVTVIIFIL